MLIKPKRNKKANISNNTLSNSKKEVEYEPSVREPASTQSIEEIVKAIQGVGSELKKTVFYQHPVYPL